MLKIPSAVKDWAGLAVPGTIMSTAFGSAYGVAAGLAKEPARGDGITAADLGQAARVALWPTAGGAAALGTLWGLCFQINPPVIWAGGALMGATIVGTAAVAYGIGMAAFD